jgi:hypothetical protein
MNPIQIFLQEASPIPPIFYHGSPNPRIKILRPRLDPRTGITGIFVAADIYAPYAFSLSPIRHKSTVNLKTVGGKFVSGKVVSPVPLNDKGYLYTIKPHPDDMVERLPGRFHLIKPTRIIKRELVTIEDVKKMGWEITIKK